MENEANNLAWIFFGTTAFVVLSLVYEGLRLAYKYFSKKKEQESGSDTEN